MPHVIRSLSAGVIRLTLRRNNGSEKSQINKQSTEEGQSGKEPTAAGGTQTSSQGHRGQMLAAEV